MAFLSLFALSAGFTNITAGGIALAQSRDPDLLRIRKGDLSIFLPSICAPGPVAAAAYRAASLAAAVAVAGGDGSGGCASRASPSRNAAAAATAGAAAAAAATALSPRRSAAAAATAAAPASASDTSASSTSPAGAAASAAALAFAGTPLVLSRDTGVKFNGTQPDRYVHWLFSAAMGVVHGASTNDAGTPPSLARRGGGAAAAAASPARQLQQQQLRERRQAAAAAAAAALTQAVGANAYLLPPHLLPPPALPSPDGGAPRILHAALDLLNHAPHERAVVEAVVTYMHTVRIETESRVSRRHFCPPRFRHPHGRGGGARAQRSGFFFVLFFFF